MIGILERPEAKKNQRKQGDKLSLPVICLLIVFMIISLIKSRVFFVLAGDSTAMLPIAWIIATVLPMFLIALAIYGVYKYGKSREKRQEK